MRLLFVTICAILTSWGNAQVFFDIKQLPTQDGYKVLAMPHETFDYPSSLIGHIQVVLRYDASLTFAPVIRSLLPGIHWQINSEATEHTGSPEFHYLRITSVEQGISSIPIVKFVGIPLFEITQVDSTCIGPIHLCDNNSPDIMALRQSGLNFTQNFSLLGVGGNAFSGVVSSQAHCDNVPVADQDMYIQPNPADEWVTVSWFFGNITKLPPSMELVVYHVAGVEMGRYPINTQSISQEHTFVVSDWPTGAYMVKILPDKHKAYPTKKFLVIH
jgi:hypothetical protein